MNNYQQQTLEQLISFRPTFKSDYQQQTQEQLICFRPTYKEDYKQQEPLKDNQ